MSEQTAIEAINKRKIKRMVLVEDDEGYAVLLQRLLERAKFDCELIWFPNGVSLLEFIEKDKGANDALILLDLNLPVMSGFEILSELRKLKSKDNLPVIVISTTIREREFQKCLEAGANSFLKKPITYNELMTVADNINIEL